MNGLPLQRGPETRPRATYNKTGIGQMKQVRGNPISWGIDCLGNCFAFLTLRGSQDPTSQALRTATAQNMQPRRNVLQSRGVIGIVERADGSGGLQQPYSVTAPNVDAAAPSSPVTSSPSSDSGTTAPTSPCGDGLVYVPLAGGKYKCAVPWGN